MIYNVKKETFGGRIMFLETLTMLMKNRGLSKAQLAKESGIPYTTIDGFYKKGCENIKLSTLQKLANYFDVTLDYLINGNNFLLSTHEKAVIMAYRNSPEMQAAVDRLLNVESSNSIANDIKSVVESGESVLGKVHTDTN